MSLDLLLSIILGVAIGLSLGSLGGGGSILTVPALVYVLGVSAKDATGASLLIVGLSALMGMLAHARAGRVRWATGASVAVISIFGSLGGTALNKRIDPDVLLLIFAMLMFVVAVAMLGRDRKSGATTNRVNRHNTAAEIAPGGYSTARMIETAVTINWERATAPKTRPILVSCVGIGVGFLTGFLGVGGGFIVVPSLVLALGLALAEAVGTSLLVIATSSVIAILERGGVHGVAPHILWPFAASAMGAAVIGNHITTRVPVRRLNQGFIVLVVAVASYVTIRSGLAIG